MRISTQIVAGYLLAVAATVAVGGLSHFYVRSAHRDVEDIAEEWKEMEAVVGALASLRSAGSGPEARERLLEDARTLARMAEDLRAHGEATEPEHEAEERALFADLARLLERAAPKEEDRAQTETKALSIALDFWNEDRGRVLRHLDQISSRQVRLRQLNLLAGLGILLLPLIFLTYLQIRIMRPLSAVQRRVEAIGGEQIRARGSSGMVRLANTIERMAEAVEARRRDLEQQVETRTLQLRHADRLGGLGRIAAAVAHEINNPLGSIGLCIEGIGQSLREKSGRQDEIERYLQTVAEEIERCKATTQKLLSYAAYHRNEHEAVSSHALVQAAVDIVAGHARSAGVRVETTGEPADATVRCDVGQLRQVLVNVIFNAIDASPRGEKVEVTTEIADAALVVRVGDHGEGVADEDRESIFHPFFTTKRPGEGTGLGLSIAREILEGHGGGIELVRPEDGRLGAMFEIRLPLQGGPA